MLRITQSVLDIIYAHAEETFPDECCGMMSSPAIGGNVDVAHRCTNIQNKLHEKEPEEYPRTAVEAYYIDPLEMMKIQRFIDDGNRHLAGIYHSHPNEESYFSAEDKHKAMWDDEPMMPDAHYIIASVNNGKIAYSKSFTCDEENEDFVEEQIEVVPDSNQ